MRSSCVRFAALAALGFSAGMQWAKAQETATLESASTSAWESAVSLQNWEYLSIDRSVAGSLLGSGGQGTGIPSAQFVSDSRLDFAWKSREVDLTLKPRMVLGSTRTNGQTTSSRDTYLSQAFARVRLQDDLTATIGRELLTWGPANFRSPSNPFYYDAGKTRPLQDVAGLDAVRVDWSQGRITSTLGYVANGRQSDEDWRQSFLWKMDYRGNDFVVGTAVSKARSSATFVGAYAQASLGDAWLVYGELGSAPPTTVAPQTSSAGATSRELLGTLGASYTLESGRTLSMEYLHDGRGYTRAAMQAYFSKLLTRQPSVGISPYKNERSNLLGRDYLYILFQSNLQDSKTYWRVSLTENILDQSRQFNGYLEVNLHPKVSVFGNLLWNEGRRNTEFGAALKSQVTVGFKFFLL